MKLGQNSTLFAIFILSAIHGFVFVHANHDEQSDEAMTLQLIHRYSPHFKGHGLDENTPKTQHELIKELHRHDTFRHQMMSNRRRQQQELRNLQGLNSSSISARRKDWETRSSMAMPVTAGWDYGYGQYLVKIKVGTPSQSFMLVADTGSDLTWVKCRQRCGRRCRTSRQRLHEKRIFHAYLSSTFKTVPCSSRMCKFDLSHLFSLQQCPTPFSPCRYDYSYVEGSAALGFFSSETVRTSLTNGRRTKLRNVLIGCTESTRTKGSGSIKGGDGILGLGLGKYSFTEKAALSFGGKFSYCLVDHQSPKNVTSYLTYGSNRAAAALRKKMSYTKLVSGNPDLGASYGVNVQGISIGGKMLNIPNQVWHHGDGGLILDSGTSLTILAMPAYKPVFAALSAALSKFKRLPDQEDPFEFCFNPTGYNEGLVPQLAFHFAGGAQFKPPVKSYVVDVADQVKCIGLVPSTQPGPSVIGNIMQQNHLWEFDLERKTLGFAPSTCT